MSAQLPPDPILTTYQYWNWANVDEETRRQRALDNTYMMFPIVQNKPTTFSKMFVELITSATQIASTFTIEDKLTTFLFAENTWTGLNTFGTIDSYYNITNSITATTLALSGTQLDTPLTPFYANPITAVGAIGSRIDGTLITLATGGGSTGINNAYVDLSRGNWLLLGQEQLVGNPTFYFIAFRSSTNEERGRKGSTQAGQTDALVMCSTFVTVTLTSGTVRWNVNTRAPTGTTLTSATITAYRLS